MLKPAGNRDLKWAIARNTLSPAIFGIVLVAFFLPFVEVSCQRTKVAELTGIRLVTGSTVERLRAAEQGTPDAVERGAEPLAIMALLVCTAGIGLHWLGGRQRPVFLAGLAFGGLILLILLKFKLEHDAQDTAEGLFQLQFRAGYWLALAGFGLDGVLNLFFFFVRCRARH